MYTFDRSMKKGAGWDEVNSLHLERVSEKPTFTVVRSVPEGGAGLRPFCFFTDGAVLRRNACVRIFGKADYEGGAAAEIDGKLYYGRAQGGSFEIWLPPMKEGTGKTLTIYGETNRVTVRDVCIGEVLLFSGQSNMEYPMYATAISWGPNNLSKQFLPYSKVTETAYVPDEEHDPETYPEYVPNKELSDRLKADANAEIEYDTEVRLMLVRDPYPDGVSLAKNDGAREDYDYPMAWKKGDDREAIMHCSMLAYYFCKELRKLTGVPVGAVVAAVGATETGAWVSRETYGVDPSVYSVKIESHDNPNSISSCYNTLIAPLLPYTFTSFVWYQGEGECASETYNAAFRSLVESYRRDMENPDMKVLVVSLPRFCMNAHFPEGYTQENYGTADPWLGMTCSASDFGRAHQRALPALLSDCAVSVSVNAGDFDDIHPSDKRAMSKQALCRYLTAFYGYSDPSLFFPEIAEVKTEGNDIVLTLDHVGTGLTLDNDGIGFEISEDGEHYRQIRASLGDGKTLILKDVLSGGKKDGTKLRYGWLEFPRVSRVDMTKYVSVFNSYGLPLDQFELTL